MNKINKGFTLIELLVVIAVIGILASVIMLSLTETRSKGADGGIRRSMQEARTQAEIFYLNNGNKYISSTGVTVCQAYNATTNRWSIAPMMAQASTLSKTTFVPGINTVQTSTPAPNGTVCHVNASGSEYAIATKLLKPKIPANMYLCMDSKQNNKEAATLLPAVTATPGVGTTCL